MWGGEAARQPGWIAERILQLELHPVPLLVWHNSLTIFARFDRYAQMAEGISGITWIEVSRPQEDGLLRPSDLPALSMETKSQIVPALSIQPVQGRIPYGVITSGIDGTTALLIHAPTELIFAVPSNATTLEVEYVIPENVYAEADFDGLMLVVEAWDGEEESSTLVRDWMPPGEGSVSRRHEFSLSETNARKIMLRVEPGPFNRNAFDQAWLKSIRFR